MRNWKRVAALAALCLAAAGSAVAQNEAAAQKAFEDARNAAKHGPSDIALIDQATLKLPAGHVFIPQPQAGEMLVAMGNPGKDERLQGLVFPEGDAQWFMTIRYEKSGYIKDDDAKDWNADELLKSYRDGTEAANEERARMGVPALEITGWAEKPAYDGGSHRLVWAMSSRHKGAPADEPQGVNYNTYALGREGYFSLNLVTDLKDLPAHKGSAQTMLAALDYQPGKRYADFDSATDHVAEYGLAALVVGVGAKKLGLFALIAAFFAKFAKLAIFAAIAFGGAILKFFGRRKSAAAPSVE